MRKVKIPFNTTTDGLCQTIKAQYYKNRFINFVEKDGQFAATCVLETYEEDTEQTW